MLAPIRLVRGGWPHPVERRLSRFVRDDPREAIAGRADPDTFRRAMALLHVGQTIKITRLGRHLEADSMLLQHVDLTGRTIVDIGASDGSSSLELIARLPDFAHFVIADLYLTATVAATARHTAVYDTAGVCVLIVGPRVMAWPGESRLIRLLFWPVLRALAVHPQNRQDLVLLNPDTQALIARDPRVTAVVHDVFEPWNGDPRPDVIKVANVLRRLYFSDQQITRALTALHASLRDDGHLLIIDNPRIAGASVSGGLYRRTGNGFELVDQTERPAEIDDLVRAISTPA